MWFKNLKIGTKLIVGFGAVIVLALALSVFGIYQLSKIDSDYSNLMDNVVSRNQSMLSVGRTYARYRRIAATAALQVGNASELNTLKEEYNSEKKKMDGYIEEYYAALEADVNMSAKDVEDRKQRTGAVQSKLENEYAPIMQNIFERAEANDEAGAKEALFNANTIASTINSDIDELISLAQGIMDTENAEATDVANFAKIILVVVSIVAILLALVIATLISRMIRMGINEVADAARRISKGDFDVSVGSNGKDEIAVLSNCLLELKTVIRNIADDINKSAHDFEAGKLEIFINEAQYEGEFKSIAESVNNTERALINRCLYAVSVINDFGNGNFNVEVKVFPGEQADMTEAVKAVKENLIGFNNHIAGIISGAIEGNLDVSMDAGLYRGDWSKMAEGINGLLSAVVKPIREAIDVLNQLSEGNLNVTVNGNYKGEFAAMKNALNDTLKMLASYIAEISSVLTALSEDNLDQAVEREYVGQFSEIKTALNTIVDKFNRVISDILAAASQVASGAKQISESSMTLAQGATEQASATEELGATISIINENTRHNADDAKEADELSSNSKENAARGNEYMNNLLTSMNNIKESSTKISRIIKVIDDIAFQTNLLALNAAVEAARAGEHGKGFAVVAEEVRTLAGRSQNSAKDTSALIEESIARVNEGTEIAGQTAGALNTIVENVTSVSDIIGNIAKSSSEQTLAISQVTDGINQISQVVQSNSATSEESASASQELSSQAELLQNLVSVFKLKKSYR